MFDFATTDSAIVNILYVYMSFCPDVSCPKIMNYGSSNLEGEERMQEREQVCKEAEFIKCGN